MTAKLTKGAPSCPSGRGGLPHALCGPGGRVIIRSSGTRQDLRPGKFKSSFYLQKALTVTDFSVIQFLLRKGLWAIGPTVNAFSGKQCFYLFISFKFF
jgi:hypothetical protein